VEYCIKRQIPRAKFDQLYYIDDIHNLEKLSDKYKGKILGNEPRLVLPFFDMDDNLVGVTCRALGDQRLRYIAIRLDDTKPMIYNLNNIDITKPVYCVEGPIDSLFIDNSVAVGSSDFGKLKGVIPQDKAVLVFDNQPRNKEIVKIMMKACDNGFKVVVWPRHIEEKDINEMLLGGMSITDLLDVINRESMDGLSLRASIQQWSKI
jgi:hypothetical protein